MSMRKVMPVMKSVSGLARKQTAAAISMGCPSLLRTALALATPMKGR
jgi:hypothetical protein